MRRKKRHPNWPLRLILLALIAFFAVYVFVVPAIALLVPSENPLAGRTSFLRVLETTQVRAAECFIAAWFFFLGSAIGSFANVVVYRMPRGMNVASKDSACPWCKTPIKMRHNIPVFGWLMLRGRCYTCRLPISRRYPIVEFVFGAVFLILYFVELISGAANLPGVKPFQNTGVVYLIMDPNWDLIGIYLYHCFLMTILLIWALISYDRLRLPWLTIIFAFAVGFIAPMIWPFLHPIQWMPVKSPDITTSVLTGVGGFLMGLLASLFVKSQFNQPHHNWVSFASCFSLVGVILGWQGFVVTLAVFALFSLLVFIHPATRTSVLAKHPLFTWTMATLAAICLWRLLEQNAGFPGENINVVPTILIVLASLAIIFLTNLTDHSGKRAEPKSTTP